MGYDDGSTVDPASQADNNGKITIDNNAGRQDGNSWQSFLNESRVDVGTKAERVYGAREGNKNTDVIATQTAETARFADPKSNLQRVSPETPASESDNTEKMIAGEPNERVFSGVDATIGYQHHDDSRETSASSRSAVKSQVEVSHRLSEK